MKPRVSVTVLTVVFAVASFLLTRVIWPDAPDAPQPAAGQLPFFIVLGVIESLTFGLGVAFIVYGLPLVRRFAPASERSTWLPWAMYVSVAWQLVSWWPHDNLHRVNGENFGGLLLIEYGFHVTLQVSAVIIAAFFLSALRSIERSRHPAATMPASPAAMPA